jgi:hypothetical protein
MQSHIQEEMFANINISKIKRAKKIVMTKWLDAKKGQYARVHDYQEELLRSNPGSTVVVTNVQQPIRARRRSRPYRVDGRGFQAREQAPCTTGDQGGRVVD